MHFSKAGFYQNIIRVKVIKFISESLIKVYNKLI